MIQWIISDTHFDHENIIRYCDRPYKNAGQMNEDLIRRWNNRIKPGDLVYHLGDFGLMKSDAPAKIIPRLNGRKVLILGNHDKTPQRMMDFGFDLAMPGMVVKVPNMNERYVYLVHRPQAILPSGLGFDISFVLHGHIHNSLPEHRRRHEAKGEIADIPDFNINCSVEVMNYEPATLEWIVKRKLSGVK